MQRTFTRNVPPRYKAGETHDYPQIVWINIAGSLGMKLDEFTVPTLHAIGQAAAKKPQRRAT